MFSQAFITAVLVSAAIAHIFPSNSTENATRVQGNYSTPKNGIIVLKGSQIPNRRFMSSLMGPLYDGAQIALQWIWDEIVPSKEDIIDSVFDSVKKYLLKKTVHSLVKLIYPKKADKLTEKILDLDIIEIIRILKDKKTFKEYLTKIFDEVDRDSDLNGQGSSERDIVSKEMLESLPPREQKKLLSTVLSPIVQQISPTYADQVVKMLVQLDNVEILRLLKKRNELKLKTYEIVADLQNFNQKKSKKININSLEPLTVASLAALPLQEQKQVLKEKLLPLVRKIEPYDADVVTKMLMQMDSLELFVMINSKEYLAVKVQEALANLYDFKGI